VSLELGDHILEGLLVDLERRAHGDIVANEDGASAFVLGSHLVNSPRGIWRDAAPVTPSWDPLALWAREGVL
jgi:hypothetical protein